MSIHSKVEDLLGKVKTLNQIMAKYRESGGLLVCKIRTRHHLWTKHIGTHFHSNSTNSY